MHPFPTRPVVILVIALVTMLLLSGCGNQPAAMPMSVADRSEPAAPAATLEVQAMEASAGSADTSSAAPPTLPNSTTSIGELDRKIIKDATFSLEVEELTIALSRIGTIAAQAGGYVLETRTDFSQEYQKSAVVKFAVPVDTFEAVLQGVREVAKEVLNEQTSGVDISQEYVDVKSQIANLEATQARIRQFLEQAQTVEEALRVNAQLTEIEGQISQLKGRLQFLTQRAAFSTITVQMQQSLAVPVVPKDNAAWDPAQVAAQAYSTLTTVMQAIATVVIWLVIVVLPLGLPVVLIGLVLYRLRRRPVSMQRPAGEIEHA